MIQCQGICLSGLRCRRNAKYNEFCHTHRTETCGVCLEEVKYNSIDLVTLTDCGHKFCKKCVYPWIFQKTDLDQNCPTCRTNISIQDTFTAIHWGVYYNHIYKVQVCIYSMSCLTASETVDATIFLNIFRSQMLDDYQFTAIARLSKTSPIFESLFQKMRQNVFKKNLFIKKTEGCDNPKRLHTFIDFFE